MNKKWPFIDWDIEKWLIKVAGGGGPRSIFTFLFFLIEVNGSYQELFSEWKNVVHSQSY